MDTALMVLCKDVSRGVGHDVSLTGGKLTFLVVIDFLFTQILVNALNVASWRGVWGLHSLWIEQVFKVINKLWTNLICFRTLRTM